MLRSHYISSPLGPVLVASLLSACVIPKSVGDGQDDDVGSGGMSAGSSPASTDPSSADGGSTFGDSTTSGDLTTSGGDATDTGFDETGEASASVCDPQPEGTVAYFALLEDGSEPQDLELDELCEITGIDTIEDGLRVGLQCETRTFAFEVLSFDVAVSLPLSMGQIVRARAFHFITIDSGRETYMALSEPEGGLLLGTQARAAIDEHAADFAGWFAPFGVQVVDDACEVEPYEPPPDFDGSFIAMPCGSQLQRQAVDLALAGAGTTRVFDDSRTTVGPYDVWVLNAVRSFAVDRPDCPVGSNSGDHLQIMMIGNP